MPEIERVKSPVHHSVYNETASNKLLSAKTFFMRNEPLLTTTQELTPVPKADHPRVSLIVVAATFYMRNEPLFIIAQELKPRGARERPLQTFIVKMRR
jgi:hypothetical protein